MRKWMHRDLSRTALVWCAVGVIALKLALTGMQLLLVTPNAAPLDDTLMYETAKSIAAGNWLGEYNWLTLSKYMFFPVWLAALHTLHIPYLLGGQLLYTAAALAGVWALAPVLSRNKSKLIVFAALLFNPAATAAEVQLRVYRDNITPALTLLLFAGVIGYALRYKERLSKSIWFALIGGAGLAAGYLNREDGAWVLPFAVVGSLVTLWFLWRTPKVAGRAAKSAALALPYVVLGAGVLIFCLLNLQYYGRFTLSDFTSREFKDAYGALTRVTAQDPQDKVPVTKQVRDTLYELSPAFAELEPYLEAELKYNNYGSVQEQEFYGGGFYWALRQAVAEAGYYKDANTAKAYYETLAQQVNELCDTGRVPAGKRRSSTMPAIKGKYVLPTLKEGAANLGRVLTFAEAEPAYWTQMSEQLMMEPQLREEIETFLGNEVNWQAQANTALPYYSPARQIAFKLLELVRWGYALLLPLGFAAAVFFQLSETRRAFARGAKAETTLVWLIMLGLGLSILLRCFMIAFMFVASFNNVVHIMYLCPAHVLALLYTVLGLWMGKDRISAFAKRLHTRGSAD